VAHTNLKAEQTITVKRAEATPAALIYQYSVASANALWAAYDLARDSRGKPRGITTDQEQDILRAMLVAAGSGLDGAIKQLIRDALPELIKKHDAVHDAFEKFTQKRLQIGEADGISGVSPKVLSRILASPDPLARLIRDYSDDLTGDSLQSTEQLFKVCNALGASQNPIGDPATLKKVFIARNQIIHELDMNLGSLNRKRRVRNQQNMQTYSERLLKICFDIIQDVDGRLDEIRVRRRLTSE
jgi:hypothetical protein